VTALLAQGVIVGMCCTQYQRRDWPALRLAIRLRLAAVAMLLLLAAAADGSSAPASATATYALMRAARGVSHCRSRWSALGPLDGRCAVDWPLVPHAKQPFGWHSDGVGALALIGAASAIWPLSAASPTVRNHDFAIGALNVLGLGLLAAFGDAVAGVIVGMIVLDLGATGADISNRTIIFSLRPEIRTRLATIYMFGKFAGAGAMAWLAGLAWSIGGWSAVCALGSLLAATAVVVAWVGVGRTAS
jgi:hypothetical protein